MSRQAEDRTEGGGKQRWSRRRLLRWVLGLVPAVAGGGWLTSRMLGGSEAGPKENVAWAAELTREAASFRFAGSPGASSILYWALRAAPSYAPARLMSACMFMEEGRWDLAMEDLSFVRETPEGRLLRELARRRPRTADWRHAFFESWKALGKPDFRDSPLLPEPLKINTLLSNLELPRHGADEALRFSLDVLGLGLMESPSEELLEQVRTSDSVPLLMAMLDQLPFPEMPEPLRLTLLPAVEQRLAALAGPSPRTLQLALVPFLADTSSEAPFERHELETLEKLVALREWKQPSSEQLFLELRERFQVLQFAPGHHAWMVATLAQGTALGLHLLRRGHASKAHLTEDEQRWMGRLLWEVGARLREQRSHLELDMELKLQLFGSELTGHSPTRLDCIGMWMELGEWEKALARAGYYRWPLASLHQESYAHRARNEHEWMKAFAGRGELP